MSEHSLVFMPWLTVKETVTIGEWQLSPLGLDPQQESDLDDRARRALEAEGVLGAVTEILGAYRVTEKYPITCCTIVHRLGSTSLVPKLANEDLDEIASLSEIITFVTLATREFFTDASNRYCNAQTSRLLIQPFDAKGIRYTVTTTYRRDGGARVFRSYDDFREYPPSNTNTCDRWDFDQALAQACWAARSRNDKPWTRLSDALVFFNAANRDEPTAPRHSDFVFMVGALQRLLRCGSEAAQLEEAVVKIIGDGSQELTASDLDKYRPHPEKSVVSGTILGTWARELVTVRGMLAHGSFHPVRKKSSRWTLSEHLLFASEVFPSLVIKWLSDGRLYTLTERDEERIDLLEVRLLLPTGTEDSFGRMWQAAQYWPDCAKLDFTPTAAYIRSALDRWASKHNAASPESPVDVLPLQFGPPCEVFPLEPIELKGATDQRLGHAADDFPTPNEPDTQVPEE